MILPSSDISIMDVRNYLGIPSTDLGTLVAKAQTGGENGFAFNITENGASNQDGTLIDGAQPYWNIWSTNQPGFWWAQLNLSDFTQSRIRHRLKYDDNQRYYFSLGSFRNHNTNAKAPYLLGDEKLVSEGNTTILLSFELEYNFGQYDWRNVLSTHQYYQVIVTKEGYPDEIIGESSITALPAPGQSTRTMIVRANVSNSPSSYNTLNPTIGRAKCYLCKSDGSQRCQMPNMEAELSILFNMATTIVGNIYVDGSLLITNKMRNGVIDKVTYARDVIKFPNAMLRNLTANRQYNLYQVSIQVRDEKTGSVLLNETQSTIKVNSLFNPKRFQADSSGEAGPYEFDWDSENSNFFSVYQTTGQEVSVNFYYN